MGRLALLLLLGGCAWRYGLSAAATVPVADTYCRPVNDGRMLCYQDNGVAWDCIDVGGYWSCAVMP